VNEYNQEQYEALCLVQSHLADLEVHLKSPPIRERLKAYLAYRKDVDDFLTAHFSDTCNRNCYRNRLSACCSKEGIVTFFADVVINVLESTADEIDALKSVLQAGESGFKCVYLGEQGCMWRVKPIVCEMFLCDRAQQTVFTAAPDLASGWASFEADKKRFTWPDRPVLFDDLEAVFMRAGCGSTLMYMHNSPGLLMVKRKAKKKHRMTEPPDAFSITTDS
jgi:hypothetical protein